MVQSPGRFWSMTIFGHRALAAIHSFPASPYLAMSRYHNFWDNKLRSAKVFVLNAGMLWSSKIGHNSPAMAYSYSLYHLFGQSSVCVFVSCVTVCPSVLVSVCLFVWLSVCMGAGTGVLMYTGPPLAVRWELCVTTYSHTPLGKLAGGLDDSRIIAVCLSTSTAFISFADQYWDIFTRTSVVFCHHLQDRLPLPCNRQSSAIPPGLDGFCDVVWCLIRNFSHLLDHSSLNWGICKCNYSNLERDQLVLVTISSIPLLFLTLRSRLM